MVVVLLAQAVDVTLPTTTSGWHSVAAVLGTVAAAATATWVGWGLVGTRVTADEAGPRDGGTRLGGPTDRQVTPSQMDGTDSGADRRWMPALLAAAVVASTLALASGITGMVVLEAVPTVAAALVHPASLALVVRILVLALAWVLERQRDLLTPREATSVRTGSAVLAGATVAVGGARVQAGGWPPALLLAVAAIVVGGIATALLWRTRADLRAAAWAVVVPVALAGIPAWLLVSPPVATPVAAVVVDTGQGTLDVSVVPARPGPAALHLYAFGIDEEPVDVDGGTITIDGSQPTPLFRAGPNHLIAYGVDLPDSVNWQVAITTSGDLAATTITTLPRP